MAVSEINFVSRETAEAQLFAPDTAVISITDPGRRPAALAAHFSPVLRMSFFDAIPGDEFIPMAFSGCFDAKMAKQIVAFVERLHSTPALYKVIVHCEQGVSRSAAVALFVEAYTRISIVDRWRAVRANPWVVDVLSSVVPQLEIDVPSAPA